MQLRFSFFHSILLSFTMILVLSFVTSSTCHAQTGMTLDLGNPSLNHHTIATSKTKPLLSTFKRANVHLSPNLNNDETAGMLAGKYLEKASNSMLIGIGMQGFAVLLTVGGLSQPTLEQGTGYFVLASLANMGGGIMVLRGIWLIGKAGRMMQLEHRRINLGMHGNGVSLGFRF